MVLNVLFLFFWRKFYRCEKESREEHETFQESEATMFLTKKVIGSSSWESMKKTSRLPCFFVVEAPLWCM